MDFSKVAEEYDRVTPFTQLFAKDCIDLLKIPESIHVAKVLDIAAGTGSFALSVLQRCESAEHGSILATDVAPPMISILKMKCDRDLPEPKKSWISSQVMDGQNLDIPNDSISYIGCVFGIMFFQDRIKGLKEMYRVLKPGGSVAIAVWKTNFFPELIEKAALKEGKISTDQIPLPFSKMLFCYADQKNLEQDLVSVGFREEDVQISEVSHTYQIDADFLFQALFQMPVITSLGLSADAIRSQIESLCDEDAQHKVTMSGTANLALVHKSSTE